MNLAKLKTYSVRDSRGKLLDSYFKDCFHRVKLGPVVSEWEMVSRGCSQGSTFGPLLWNIYQKSYVCMILILTSTCTVYADDHLFYAMSSDLEIVKKLMFPVSLMYGAQLCFALKKFKWENCLKFLSKQN